MNNIVDFNKLREEKEKQLLSFSSNHLVQLQTYIDRQTNIREKVKAKHIFREKVHCSKEHVFSEKEEKQFQDWFTYDYQTIQGKTNYQLFLDTLKRNQHPLHPIIYALFLASVLEPFKVINITETHIYAENLLTKESGKILSKGLEGLGNEMQGALVFIRTIPILNSFYNISTPFIQPNHVVVRNLQQDVKESTDHYRTFLKKYSIKYTWDNGSHS
ncbi:hypothetical protein ACNRWW_16100 [Metabacillus sp. HB246100]